jgi:hypothetical protein
MPTSDYSLISSIVDIVFKAKPRTVLDIGIGFGKYGFLFREYLDIYGHTSLDDYKKSGWKTRIDGIEIYEPYILEHQKFIYSNLYIGDACELLPKLDDYDLIFIGDVLEHLPQKEGNTIIETMKRKAKYVIFAVPLGRRWEQVGAFGNQNETHQNEYFECDFSFAKLIKVSQEEEGRDIGLFLYTNPSHHEAKEILKRINIEDRNGISFHGFTPSITYRIQRKLKIFTKRILKRHSELRRFKS